MTTPSSSETFGERIRSLRKKRGLNQKQLASLVGRDNTYLSKLENDQPGQSPGEDLVRSLARELGDNPEELLALAGKVPVEVLRTRAREDTDFARSLRLLSEIPDTRIAELVVPPPGMATVGDAQVEAKLELTAPKGGPDTAAPRVVCSFRMDFDSLQDQYVVGVVAEKDHRDRLRHENAPIDEILVDRAAIHDSLTTAEIVSKYAMSIRHRAHRAGDYESLEFEQVQDPSPASSAGPLTILRARFPTQRRRQPRRIEVAYRMTLPEGHWYWFWRASRPTYVSRITVDAGDLGRHYECDLEDFLPGFERHAHSFELAPGVYVVRVDNWVVRGHGVVLGWS